MRWGRYIYTGLLALALLWCGGVFMRAKETTIDPTIIYSYAIGNPKPKRVTHCGTHDAMVAEGRETPRGESFLLQLCFQPMVFEASFTWNGTALTQDSIDDPYQYSWTDATGESRLTLANHVGFQDYVLRQLHDFKPGKQDLMDVRGLTMERRGALYQAALRQAALGLGFLATLLLLLVLASRRKSVGPHRGK